MRNFQSFGKGFASLRQGPASLSKRFDSSLALLFGPGLFFVVMGLVTLFAPGLLLAVIAGIFLFLGLSLAIIAWKFIQLKKRVEKVAKGFDGRVYIQGLTVESPEDYEVVDDEKKIVFH